LQDAIKTGREESIVGVFRQLAGFFARGLALTQKRTQSVGAVEQFVDGKVGLGRWNVFWLRQIVSIPVLSPREPFSMPAFSSRPSNKFDIGVRSGNFR
jgi:hypothetical protein